MKEQVKEIIDSYGMFYNPKKLEECAEEVVALFPQGEGGLLEEREIADLIDVATDRDYKGTGCIVSTIDVEPLLKAQHALDQHHEAQVLKEQMERVIGIVIDSFYGHRNYAREAPEGVNWKEFLFSTLDHMENELVATLKAELDSE